MLFVLNNECILRLLSRKFFFLKKVLRKIFQFQRRLFIKDNYYLVKTKKRQIE